MAEEKEEAVVVHCMGGKGRTGTMLACYLVKFCKLSAPEAVSQVRMQRPGSIETCDQKKAVYDLEARLNKK